MTTKPASTVQDRVKAIASHYKLSILKFEKISGLSNGYVRRITDSIGNDKLEAILMAFPKINREWLATGRSSMFGVVEPNRRYSSETNEIIASFMAELEERDRQIDRLLAIIETNGKMNGESK